MVGSRSFLLQRKGFPASGGAEGDQGRGEGLNGKRSNALVSVITEIHKHENKMF
jgi:hypothetical protein